MVERRKGCAYRQRSHAAKGNSLNRVTPPFRSDNDLHQLRYEWSLMAGMASAMIVAFETCDVPLRLWPMALGPVISVLLLGRWHALRLRRMGKRFSHYEDDSLSR